ncbi:histidine kinase [Virgibacillus sp. YIM 98842]|jgi:signal transduction histidine kinase|uniref:sensor histidine kinase n=1 Tax=Virgibacillus sp. YIM 98842 TaxID=2663533 RepID=UPI0013DAF617|nr:histidine kinase [Virgibacillus sp. YIM 98842]
MKTGLDANFFINGWRFLNIILLIHLWIIGDSNAGNFILILLLLLLASLRWRLSLPAWSVLFDLFFCLLYIPYTNISHYGLALPLFELVLKGKWLYSVLLFLSSIILLSSSDFIFWHLLQAMLFGAFSYFTLKNQHVQLERLDALRKSEYELERLKTDLLKANQSTSQQARLLERNRISRQLHDHLGHDLTGASLAIQAYEHMEDQQKAEQLLEEVKKRIQRSTIHLRETVHNMSSTVMTGAERMEEIINDFHQFDTSFKKYGDTFSVPAYIWSLLESCLKECLTNTARHSNATKTDIDLQVTDALVRLSIQDNGTKQNKKTQFEGSGLRSLQLRTRALDGSLSISNEDGFLVVCVIPLQEGVDRD